MQKVAVVCHDAGGAEVVSNWMEESTSFKFMSLLAGPALRIFTDNLRSANCSNCDDLDNLVAECDWLLCGTSWQSSIELDAIKKFRSANKKTVAFLDHWVNYEERFEIGSKLVLPDEIWVGDHYAFQIANEKFKTTPVIKVGNAYFNKIKNQFLDLSSKGPQDKISCLYVCEPIKEHAFLKYGDARYWGYTEEDALEYFLTHRLYISNHIETVVIRPHPSERSDKYNWVLEKYGDEINLEIGGKLSISEEISNSVLVVGCESMAMVLGLLADKVVISSIPPGGKCCSLPHKEIKSLQNVVRKNNASAV